MSRVVLITGASGGLGKVPAKTLQSKGLQVFGTMRMLRRMEQDTVESKLTPEQVSEAIFKVIQNPNKPPRKPLDKAEGLTVVKRLAPQFLIDKLIGRLLSAGQGIKCLA